MDKIKPYDRRKLVFRILAEHGPMSVRGLSSCMTPAISKKKLRVVLSRLVKQGYLKKRNDRVFGNAGVFYQIPQDEDKAANVAKLLSVDTKSLIQPHFRHGHLLHSEQCAVWTEAFKLLVPEARVIRDHQFKLYPKMESLLLSRGDDIELRPDMVLLVKSQARSGDVAVALEIERSTKCKRRLLMKLRKYATQTRLDGMIYVCESAALTATLRHIYKAQVLENALRIKHYGNNFFLITDGSFNGATREPLMFNAATENVLFSSWINRK